MNTCRVILAALLAIQMAYLPCEAQEGVVLNGNTVDQTNLKVGIYVAVTYQFDGKQIMANGYIQSVRKKTFTVLDISLKTIKYEDVITLQIKPKPKASEGDLIGQWVRITTKTQSDTALEGKLMAVSATELTLRKNNRQMGIPIPNVTQFETSIGYKRKTLRGFEYGLLTGATITVLAASISSPKTDDSFLAISDRDVVLALGIVIIMPISSIIGSIIGFNSKVHTWQTVDIPKVDVGILPMQNQGIGARLSMALQ